MNRTHRLALAALLAFPPAPALADDRAQPDPKQLDVVLGAIKPAVFESAWSDIPWMLDLTAARRKAAAEGKPLFVWTMSGEPLGQC